MWRVEFSKSGERDLKALDTTIRRAVLVRLAWLAEDFDSKKPESLHGDLRDFYKLRVGDWRIAYIFNSSQLLISVRMIDHRSKIYKRKI